MTTACNIWMICSELNWFVYNPSWMLHLSEFVWTLHSSMWVVFNNFLLIDTTDRSKISSNKKLIFIALSPYPVHLLRTLPLRKFPYFMRKTSLTALGSALAFSCLGHQRIVLTPKMWWGLLCRCFSDLFETYKMFYSVKFC